MLTFTKMIGDNPRIWIDMCVDYFTIFNIPMCMWTTAASLHMEDNAAKWLQVYKLQHGLGDWQVFVDAVQHKFGAYDYHKAIQDLLSVKQEGSVEDYTQEFQAIQFQVSMFNVGFDELFFTSHFINGLKEDIKLLVQPQLPNSVNKATLLARIPQQALERHKAKPSKWGSSKTASAKSDSSQASITSPLWKER
jgi:hypothetical protein